MSSAACSYLEGKNVNNYAEDLDTVVPGILQILFYLSLCFVDLHLSISLDNDQLDTHLIYLQISLL